MSRWQPRWHPNEESVGVAVGYVLRTGVLLSAAVILLGMILGALQGGDALALGAAAPRTFGDVWQGLAARQPVAVVALGVLILLGTPWIRVAISLVLFIRLRDGTYSLICLALLLLLTVGLVLGHG